MTRVVLSDSGQSWVVETTCPKTTSNKLSKTVLDNGRYQPVSSWSTKELAEAVNSFYKRMLEL